jgi:two-component sensor histidine kinase
MILFLTALEAVVLSLAFMDRYMILKKAKDKTDKLLVDELKKRQIIIESEINKKTKNLNFALEKEKILLKELYHRSKNNLQLILSLVRMQSDRLNEKTKIKCIDLESRINAISKTYEILYAKDNLEKIDMKEYIFELCKDLENFSQISLIIDKHIDKNIYIPLQEASYIGLIINEIIINSIKYVKKENVKIFLKFNIKDNLYILSIKDNGDGFEYDKLKKTGLGIKLIETLVKHQLNGQVKTKKENGFEYVIKFKI